MTVRRRGTFGLTALDALVDFFTVNGHILGGGNPNSDLISLDSEDGDRHFITNHQGFTDPPG